MQRMTSNTVLNEIFNNAPCGLHSLDKNGIFSAINDTELSWLGYTREEVVNKLGFADICTEAGRGKFREEFPKFIKAGFVRDIEFDMVRKDGTILPVLLNSRANYDENGEFVSTNAFVLNLTEVRVAEQEVRAKTKSLELLNMIGKSISGQLDLQTIIQRVTDATTELTKAQFGAFFYNVINEEGESFMLYTLSGAPREKFEKFGLPRNTAVFHPTFSGEGPVRVDDITKDPRYGKNPPHQGMPAGHLPVVSYLAVPVISKSGDVIGGLFFGHPEKGVFTREAEEMVVGVASQAAIAMDNAKLFEDLKKANENNKELLGLARELDIKKDEFISMASHELRTPLTSIKGYIQLLETKLKEKDTDAYTYVVKTENSINRLQRLVEDLLDVSKIQSGRLQFDMSAFSLDEVVTESVEEMNYTVPSRRIVVEGTTNAPVHGDRARIIQVLINLLNNAIKYSPDADEVQVQLMETGKDVTVMVRDFGIGIPREHHEKIFERFHRVPHNFDFTGLGIGLYISSEIIRRHNGTIRVESEPGRGSSFYFSLPVAGLSADSNSL
jgi:PAS domain S-box-containing protein